jgi:hypothetical protein
LPTELYDCGDSLKGHRIAVQARDIDPPRVVGGSGAHKIQQTKLRVSAYCVIEMPMKSRMEKPAR